MSERANPRRLLAAALALHFFAVAAIVLCRTYIDLLFLVTYPRAWLPWLFLGQTAIALGLTFALAPVVARGSPMGNAGLVLVFAASAVGARWLLVLGLPGVPFALCLWLSGCGTVIGVLAWSAVGDVFDVRQFKRFAKWINAAGSVGAAVLGTAIPLLIAVLSTEHLLFALGGAMALAAACLAALVPPAGRGGGGGRAASGGPARSPFGYPLFTQLALGAAMLMLIDTFSDYAIKAELAAAYDKEGIGRFMGPFYGLSSLATLVSQFGLTDLLASSFGVNGLLAPLPAFCLLAGAALAARPGLWTAAALRFGQNVARYGVDNLGREIAARPLPAPIRRKGKLYIKGLATPIGAGVAAALLWLAAERVGLFGVGVVTAVACALWLAVTSRTGRSYQAALEDAIGAGRLSVAIDEVSPESLHQARAVARQAISSEEPEAVRFGLQLLEEAGQGALPAEVARQLEAAPVEIRVAAARAARSFDRGTAVPALLARLEVEQAPAVQGQLLEALAALDPSSAVSAAEALLAADAAEVRAGAVMVLLSAGDLDALVAAAGALQGMLASEDRALRLGAARAIGGLRAGRLERELRALVGDDDAEVRLAGIQAVAARRTEALAPDLVSLLERAAEQGGQWASTARQARKALSAIGEPALPVLVEAVTEGGSPRTAGAALRALAGIPGGAAEGALLALAPRVRRCSTQCLLAREVASRARRWGPAEETRRAARALVHAEAELARTLAGAALCASLPQWVCSELRVHRGLALTRMLHWFAICTNKPAEVLDAVPAVVGAGSGSRRGAAVELLDSFADRDLRRALAVIEERPREPGNCAGALGALEDEWVDWLLAAKSVGEADRDRSGVMDVAQKVMLLRKVNLFTSLPGDVLLTIAEACEPRELAAEQLIFAEGDAPDGLYIVVSGQVKIRRKERTLVELGASEFFGEVALLDDDPRMADAVAVSDGLALFMDRDVFRRVTEDLPEVLRAVTRTLIQYLKHAEQASGRQTLF